MTTSTRAAWRPAWFVGLGAGLLACVAYGLVPSESPASSIVYDAVGGLTVLVMLGILLRMPARERPIWWAIWSYALLSILGDIVYNVEVHVLDQAPSPGPADLIYLLGYGAAFLALAMLVRRIHPGRDLEAWLDTAILTIAATSVVGVFIIEPTVARGDASGPALAIAIAYPLIDIVLLSGLVRLFIGRGPTNPAVAIVAVAFLTTFVADLVYSWVSAGGLGGSAPGWLDALYLAAYVAFAAAAAAPGARSIGTETDLPGPSLRPVRTLGLAAGALTVPTILVIIAWTDNTQGARVLAVACVAVIVLVLWRFRLLLDVVEAQSEQLASLARTDSLTVLPNRRTLDFELERIEAETTASGAPLTIAMMDLDHFKDFNDIHGHQAGDHALIACADAWRGTLSSPAFLARYGGEEFAVLLPGTGLATAQPLLEALRTTTPHPHTVSIGYAERRPGESGFETMSRADRALYRAKQTGRDRTVTHTPRGAAAETTTAAE